MLNIAINGFGRIGRPVFRRILDKHPNLKIVGINDLTDTKTLSYLLKHDSLYGLYSKKINYKENSISVDGNEFLVSAKTDPATLPWQKLGVDIVLECTGRFTDFKGAKKHLEAGAKKVIVSAPSKNSEIPTFVLGVNEEKYDHAKDNIISNSSCTTNCLGAVAKIIHQSFEIENGFMTTVHSYTNDQKLLDLPHRDLRRARAANLSIIPTTTGAAKSIEKIIPELKNKLNGIALRVPTPTVSVIDLICQVKNSPSGPEEVNDIFKKLSTDEKFKNILGIEDEQLVSIDYRGNPSSAIIDAKLTMAINNLVKVVAWYDNEWGYACRLAEMAEFIGRSMK